MKKVDDSFKSLQANILRIFFKSLLNQKSFKSHRFHAGDPREGY